jgi:hypothetical protein
MTLQSVIIGNIQDWVIENVKTSLPAKVLKVSDFEDHQRVTVQPTLDYTYKDGVVLEFPAISGVPVQYPSGGGGVMTFPIAVGDFVTLQFSMLSMKEWLAGVGDNVTPEDSRSYNYADAVAIPGLTTYQTNFSPNPLDVEIKFNGSSFKLNSDGSGKGVTLTTDANVEVNCVQANVNASESVNVDSPAINLGVGGPEIARKGDAVEVTVVGGSSSGTHSGTITGGSSQNTSA